MADSLPQDDLDIEDHVFGGINQLTRSLHDLDDRGLVLSLAAFAEDALGSLLKAFLIPGAATTQLLDGFNAPLGTFSSRIKAAYSMGLITEEQFLDLERLRKIRNEFAHTWRPISLAEQKLTSLAESMSFSRIEENFPDTVAKKVRSSMSCLLVEIRVATEQLQKRGAQARMTGSHLIAGFAGKDFSEQFENAKKHFSHIQDQVANVQGRELDFYHGLLKRLSDRVVFMRPETNDQKNTFLTLQAEIRNAVQKIPA